MNKIETKEEKADRLKKESRRLETLMFISLANPPPEIERAINSWKRGNENLAKGLQKLSPKPEIPKPAKNMYRSKRGKWVAIKH